MTFKIEEKWLSDYDADDHHNCVDSYFEDYKGYLNNMNRSLQRKECISGINRMKRAHHWTCKGFGITVMEGDVCFADFGHSYINECSFQHFALVLKYFHGKAFVIPMTSNETTVQLAKHGARSHLYYLGKLKGLDKDTCLFINDGRFINTARIISINAHLDSESCTYQEICKIYEKFFMIE
ncbi:MAG TPA: hypothetical protein VIG45_04175 [Erysipelothrix sp.]